MEAWPIVWVWSKLLTAHQRAGRQRRIDAAVEALSNLRDRIVSPRRSGTVNPSLTIAANGMRCALHPGSRRLLARSVERGEGEHICPVPHGVRVSRTAAECRDHLT